MSTEMRRSWLVQRLQKPRRPGLFGKDNPFAFGGGLVNGGLSGEAMDLLRDVFSFDYMGAAEFEFGAVPKALSAIAEDAEYLRAATFDVDLATVPASWKDKSKGRGSATVYLLARADQAGEAEARIRAWASEAYNDLKETTHVNTSLRPTEDWHGDRVGWLELDNGFLFFTDRTMWEQTCALFGVAAEVAA